METSTMSKQHSPRSLSPNSLVDDPNDPFQLKFKPDKLCGICGDKALGFNFNAITCEACKAFFRRNALRKKEFKCPFQGDCRIDALTRRFCQRCRLKKCFDIGMKKEWILSEDEKKSKRQKIVENRKKKILKVNNSHGGRESRLSMDNYDQDSDQDSSDTYNLRSPTPPPFSFDSTSFLRIKTEPSDGSELTHRPSMSHHAAHYPPQCSPSSYHLNNHAQHSSSSSSVFDPAAQAYNHHQQQYQAFLANGSPTQNGSSSAAHLHPHFSISAQQTRHLASSQSLSRTQHLAQASAEHPARSFGSQDSNTSDSVSPASESSYSAVNSFQLAPGHSCSPRPLLAQAAQHVQYQQQHQQQQQEFLHRSTTPGPMPCTPSGARNETMLRRNTMHTDYSRGNVSPATINYRHQLTKSFVDSQQQQQQNQGYGSSVACAKTASNPSIFDNIPSLPLAPPPSSSSATEQSFAVPSGHQSSTSFSQFNFPQQSHALHKSSPSTVTTNGETSQSQQFFDKTFAFNSFYYGKNFENGGQENGGQRSTPPRYSHTRSIREELNGYISSEDESRSLMGGESDDNSRPLSVGSNVHRLPSAADNLSVNSISILDSPQNVSADACNKKAPSFTAMELLHLEELAQAGQSLGLDKIGKSARRNIESLAQLYELVENLLQRLITMTQQLSTFEELCDEDRSTVSKSSMTEMLVLQAVVAFDRDQDCWAFHDITNPKLGTTESIVLDFADLCRIETIQAKDDFHLDARRFMHSFAMEWIEDRKLFYLMLVLLLFTPNKSNLRHIELIHLQYATYHHLLNKYLEIKYADADTAKAHYNRIMAVLQLVPIMNDKIVQRYYQVHHHRSVPVDLTGSISSSSSSLSSSGDSPLVSSSQAFSSGPLAVSLMASPSFTMAASKQTVVVPSSVVQPSH